jgi:hypothetical protein
MEFEVYVNGLKFIPGTDGTPGETVELLRFKVYTFDGSSGFHMPLDKDADVDEEHVIYMTADGDVYLTIEGCPASSLVNVEQGGVIVEDRAVCLLPVDQVHRYTDASGQKKEVDFLSGNAPWHMKVTYAHMINRFGAEWRDGVIGQLVKIKLKKGNSPIGWQDVYNAVKCGKDYFQCYKIKTIEETEPQGTIIGGGGSHPGNIDTQNDCRWINQTDCNACAVEGGAKLAAIGMQSLIEHGFAEAIEILSVNNFSTLETGETERAAWTKKIMKGETNEQIAAIPGGSHSTKAVMKHSYTPRNSVYINSFDVEAMLEVTRSITWNVYRRWQQIIEVSGDYDYDQELYENISVRGLDLSMKKLFMETVTTTSANMKIHANINENFKFGFDMSTNYDDSGLGKINASAFMSLNQITKGLDPKSTIDDCVSIKFNLGGSFFQGGQGNVKDSAGKSVQEVVEGWIGDSDDAIYIKDIQCNYKATVPNGFNLGGKILWQVGAGISSEGVNPSLSMTWQRNDATSFKMDFNKDGFNSLGVAYNPTLYQTSKERRMQGVTPQEVKLMSGMTWNAQAEKGKQMEPNLMMSYKYGDMVSFDADLLTGDAQIQFRHEILNIKDDKSSLTLAAWLRADADLSNGWFTAGIDLRYERSLFNMGKVLGRVKIFAEGGFNIGVGGTGNTTGIVQTGFTFFAGVKVGVLWKNNIFQYLGFPFNINFAPSIGLAMDVNWGVVSSYGTRSDMNVNFAFGVNMGLAALQVELVDGLRAELTRKHKSVFGYIPLFGRLLKNIPIINILGDKETVEEYVERAGPHRAAALFTGCTEKWEKSLEAYRKTPAFVNARNRDRKKESPPPHREAKDLLANWHAGNNMCNIVTTCFDSKRMNGYKNSWASQYFPLSCNGPCKDDEITLSEMLAKFSTTEQEVYDAMIRGEQPMLATRSTLFGWLKDASGWNKMIGYLKRTFWDAAEGRCGSGTTDCTDAYKRYEDYRNTGALQGPGTNGAWSNPSVKPTWIGESALKQLMSDIDNVETWHANRYKLKSDGSGCEFCIQQVYHMYMQELQCTGHPQVEKGLGLLDPMFAAFSTDPSPCDDANWPEGYDFRNLMSDYNVDKADVVGWRSFITTVRQNAEEVLSDPTLNSPVFSHSSTFSVSLPVANQVVFPSGVSGLTPGIAPMYTNMGQIMDDLKYVLCGSWTSAQSGIPTSGKEGGGEGPFDLGRRTLERRYWILRKLQSYIQALASLGSTAGLHRIQVKAITQLLSFSMNAGHELRLAIRAKYKTIDSSCYDGDGDSKSIEQKAVTAVSQGKAKILRHNEWGGMDKGALSACDCSYSEAIPRNFVVAAYNIHAPRWGLSSDCASAYGSGRITYCDWNKLQMKITFGSIPLSFIFFGQHSNTDTGSDHIIISRLSTIHKTTDPNISVKSENEKNYKKWQKCCKDDKNSSCCKKGAKVKTPSKTSCFGAGGSNGWEGMDACCTGEASVKMKEMCGCYRGWNAKWADGSWVCMNGMSSPCADQACTWAGWPSTGSTPTMNQAADCDV